MTTPDHRKSLWPSRLLNLATGGFLLLTFVVLFWPERLGVRPDAAIYAALALAVLGTIFGFFAMRFAVGGRLSSGRAQPPPDALAKAMNESRLIFSLGFAALLGWNMASRYWDGSATKAAVVALSFGALGGAFGWGAGHLFAVSMRAMFGPPKEK